MYRVVEGAASTSAWVHSNLHLIEGHQGRPHALGTPVLQTKSGIPKLVVGSFNVGAETDITVSMTLIKCARKYPNMLLQYPMSDTQTVNFIAVHSSSDKLKCI